MKSYTIILSALCCDTAIAFVPSLTPSKYSLSQTSPKIAGVGRSESTQLTAEGTGQDADEFYPHDPAETTPQLLKSIWHQIAQGNSMVKGVSGKHKILY